MIIGLVGFMGSGKDTVADMFIQQGFIKDSFASPLKDTLSSVFGWPRHLMEGDTIESRDFRETPDMFWSRKLGIPNFTPRVAMQLIGTDVMREHFYNDIWLNSLEYRLRCHKKNTDIVISDARFKNELDLIKSMSGAIVWVQRGELPEWYETAVEANQGNVISNKLMQTKFKDVHRSEWDWAGYEVDYVITNNGSLDELKKETAFLQNKLHVSKLKAI